jgi:tripartite-type tricarboxylate transporter receptor subunit TctC
VRIVVPFAPGGTTDILAGLIGQWLSERFGQQIIVENRPGAGTNVGTEMVVKSAPDGYTILFASTSGAINATLYDKLNFNFMRDLVPVVGVSENPLVMQVNPSVPARTISEFIAYAKANPNKVDMASARTGTSNHLCGELFNLMAGIRMLHVPYRGEGPAFTDILGGQVNVLFAGMPSSIEHIRAGKLRALGVTTATRSEAQPDIPAIAEFLTGYEASAWFGVSLPKGAPADGVEKLNAEINIAVSDPKIRARLAELGGRPIGGSPADFGKLIAAETEKWAKVIRAVNIKAG